MQYADFSAKYFPAFYYAYGRNDHDVMAAGDFANWYVENWHEDDPNREISKMYARWEAKV